MLTITARKNQSDGAWLDWARRLAELHFQQGSDWARIGAGTGRGSLRTAIVICSIQMPASTPGLCAGQFFLDVVLGTNDRATRIPPARPPPVIRFSIQVVIDPLRLWLRAAH